MDHRELATDHPLGTTDELITRDERDLHRFGYAQELFRTMGGFSNFALSFSIISILTGAVTLYDYGLSMGGPAEMAFTRMPSGPRSIARYLTLVSRPALATPMTL